MATHKFVLSEKDKERFKDLSEEEIRAILDRRLENMIEVTVKQDNTLQKKE